MTSTPTRTRTWRRERRRRRRFCAAGGAGGASVRRPTSRRPTSVAGRSRSATSTPIGSRPRGRHQQRLGAAGWCGRDFGPATEFAASPRSTLAVAVGDFNADSDPDLAVARRQGGSILLNSTFGPEAPTITDTDPDSAASDNAPEVKGTAAANTTVRLYTTPDCSGTPAATGSAAAFASPGLTVSVPDDSTTTLRATTDDRGVISGCSTNSITYTEVSSPPSASLSAAPNLALTGDTVNFDASGTGGLAKTRYEWDLDGTARSRSTPVATEDLPHVPRARARSRPAFGSRTRSGSQDIATVPVVAKLRPPPGGVGVTINHGAEFTNDPNVTLSPVWPAYTDDVAGHRGRWVPGLGGSKWRGSHGPLRHRALTRRSMSGSDGNAPTYTDDIVLNPEGTHRRASPESSEGGREASAEPPFDCMASGHIGCGPATTTSGA